LGGKITLPVAAADRSAMLRCTIYGIEMLIWQAFSEK
jgi:hypothetical protein